MNFRGLVIAMLLALSWVAPAAAQPAIPAEVRCYVDAVNGKDLERLLARFTDDAVIVDLSRRIEGLDAVRRWADAFAVTALVAEEQCTDANAKCRRARPLIRQ